MHRFSLVILGDIQPFVISHYANVSLIIRLFCTTGIPHNMDSLRRIINRHMDNTCKLTSQVSYLLFIFLSPPLTLLPASSLAWARPRPSAWPWALIETLHEPHFWQCGRHIVLMRRTKPLAMWLERRFTLPPCAQMQCNGDMEAMVLEKISYTITLTSGVHMLVGPHQYLTPPQHATMAKYHTIPP